MEQNGSTPINPEDQEKFNRLQPEVFVHDPEHPEITERIAREVHAIEQSRFPEDEAFAEEEFLDAFINTTATEDNGGKTNTAVLLCDPVDGSIFGFTYTMPAERVYCEGEEDDAFFPERLQNPNLERTAYVYDTVFRQSGSGGIKKIMPVLERELIKKGYQFLERDSTTSYNYANNLIRNNANRILETNEHDSIYGPQMFIRMKL